MSVRIQLKPEKSEEDLVIFYEDSEKQIHKIKVSMDKFLNEIKFYQKMSKELQALKSIHIQENIPFKYFDEFIRSTQTHEIDINDDNFGILEYLSKKYEYSVLQNHIQEYKQKRPDIILIINELTNEPNSANQNDNIVKFDFSKEEIIAKNLDISLKNSNMQKIPLQILNRILNSPKKVIKDYHLLFSFVISMIKTKINANLSPEEKDSLLILPSCLDYCKMTNDEIVELFQTEQSLNFFEPSNPKKIIGNMISNEKMLIKRIDDLEKQIKMNEEFFNQKIEETKNYFSESLKKIESTQKNLIKNDESFESRIDKVEINQTSFISKLNDHDSMHSKSELILNDVNQKLKILDEAVKTTNCSDGVFKYLLSKYEASKVSKEILKIEGNSLSYYAKNLPNIIDSNKNINEYWCSNYIQNSFIKISFKNFLVKINQYRIKVGWPNGDYFFTNWTLKGITEKNEEIILDDVTDNKDINMNHPETTSNVHDKPFVRSIQLIMNGDHNNGTKNRYAMCVRNIELFGIIKEL